LRICHGLPENRSPSRSLLKISKAVEIIQDLTRTRIILKTTDLIVNVFCAVVEKYCSGGYLLGSGTRLNKQQLTIANNNKMLRLQCHCQ